MSLPVNHSNIAYTLDPQLSSLYRRNTFPWLGYGKKKTGLLSSKRDSFFLFLISGLTYKQIYPIRIFFPHSFHVLKPHIFIRPDLQLHSHQRLFLSKKVWQQYNSLLQSFTGYSHLPSIQRPTL